MFFGGGGGNKVWLKRGAIAFAAWYVLTSPTHAAHAVKNGGNKVSHGAHQVGVFADAVTK